MAQSEYVFRRVEDKRELERLRMIESVFDPASRRRLLATGIVGQSDLERYCRFADDPNTWAIYYATIAVNGRKAER